MKLGKRLRSSMICFILVMILFGCSGGGVGDDPDTPTKATSFYRAGASVSAMPYQTMVPMTLFIETGVREGASGFRTLENGDYFPPGTYRLGVDVPVRMIDDAPLAQRVFVSDGGYDHHVEAFFEEEAGLYTCSFTLCDDYLTYPLLIQAIYPDGRASKEKYVVLTRENQKAPEAMLVKHGLGITVGNDLLAGFDTMIESMLTNRLGMKVVVQEFSSADNGTGADDGVFHLNLKNLLDGDMIVMDQKGRDRGLSIAFEDVSLFSENFFGQFMGSLVDPMLQFSLGAIGFDLAEMLRGLGGDDADDDDMMATLLGNLDIEKILFVNVFGQPRYTTPTCASLGGGLFAYAKDAVMFDAEGEYLWPEVRVDDAYDPIDLTAMVDNNGTNLGVALSQYNLNQILSGLMEGFKLVIDAHALSLPFITPENPEDPMSIHVTVNPQGIALDMTDHGADHAFVMAVNDLRLTFVEADVPMAEISADITLDVTANVRADDTGFFLDLAFEPMEALSHIHVMKDNKGLGIFDHARLVKTIFNALTHAEEDGPLTVSLNLLDFGLEPKSRDLPGQVYLDGSGNCFLALALDRVDPKALLGEDACFIETAGIF